jgi:hypothetical protein
MAPFFHVPGERRRPERDVAAVALRRAAVVGRVPGSGKKGTFSAQKREISIASRTFRRYIASARPTGQIAEKEKHPQWQQAQ